MIVIHNQVWIEINGVAIRLWLTSDGTQSEKLLADGWVSLVDALHQTCARQNWPIELECGGDPYEENSIDLSFFNDEDDFDNLIWLN